MPAHAAWFRYDTIHGVERNALPDFFLATSAAKNSTVRQPCLRPLIPCPSLVSNEETPDSCSLLCCGSAPASNLRNIPVRAGTMGMHGMSQ